MNSTTDTTVVQGSLIEEAMKRAAAAKKATGSTRGQASLVEEAKKRAEAFKHK